MARRKVRLAGRYGFRIPDAERIFLYSKMSRPVVGPTVTLKHKKKHSSNITA